MNRNGYGLGVLASLALTGLAAATVHVKYLDSSNGQIGSIANYSSGAAITVNISSSSIAKVMVYSDTPTSDNIGTISVIGTNTQSINLYVAQSQVAADAFYTSTGDAAGQDFGGIQGNIPSNREVHAKIYVLDDQIGSITVSHLETLQVDQVNSNIQSTRGFFKVKCASVGSGCSSMKQTAGKISRIEVTGTGNCNFDIEANGNGSGTDGDIDVIDVGGEFSHDTTPYPHITAGGRIGSITAGTLRNTISANEEIGFITTTVGGFKGSLTTPKLFDGTGARMQIAGAFEAVTTLSDGLPSDSTIVIGSWSGDQSTGVTNLFELQGPHRLAGQIIINANNSGGVWYDPITVVGTSTLTLGPGGQGVYYSSTSAALGGGAVGLAVRAAQGRLRAAPRTDRRLRFVLGQQSLAFAIRRPDA
jgi:hypothetical protein